MKRNLLGKGLVAVVILIFLKLEVQTDIATALPLRKIFKQIVYTCYTLTSYIKGVDECDKVK